MVEALTAEGLPVARRSVRSACGQPNTIVGARNTADWNGRSVRSCGRTPQAGEESAPRGFSSEAAFVTACEIEGGRSALSRVVDRRRGMRWCRARCLTPSRRMRLPSQREQGGF